MQYGGQRNLPNFVDRVAGRGSMLFILSMTIAERVSRLMHERDRSQSWLEKQTGISQSAISRFLRGEQRLYFDQAVAISAALEVSLDELAGLPPKAQERTPEESTILKMVETLGFEKAMRRLMHEDGVTFGPASTAAQSERRTGTR